MKKAVDFKKFVMMVFAVVAVMFVVVGCGDDDDEVVDNNPTPTIDTTKKDTSQEVKLHTYQPGVSGYKPDTTVTLAEGYDAYVQLHSRFYFDYYWNKNIPNTFTEEYYKKFSSPEEMVEAFIVSKDKWSYAKPYEENDVVVDGFKYRTYYLDNSKKNLYLIVEFVHEKCPFKAAGLRRGVAITKIDGKKLTSNNYEDLLYKSTKTITFVEISTDKDGNIQFGDEENTTPTIAANTFDWSGILLENKIETPTAKVGYILFAKASSISDSTAIAETFQNMKTMNVDELVLDMRLCYGSWSGGELLASYVVPSNQQGKPFLTKKWNDRYASVQIKIPKSTYNLDLKRVFILTTDNYRVCPFITGIRPYTDVILIGTDCEYDGLYLLERTFDFKKEITFKMITGEVFDRNGNVLSPYKVNYKVDDTYVTELGDPSEPLLAKALELINE